MLFLSQSQREQVKSLAVEAQETGAVLDSLWRIIYYPDIHPLADEEVKSIIPVTSAGHKLECLLTL